DIRDVEAQTAMYKKVTEQAAAVDHWLATDVDWLDQLNEFAHRVRPEPLAAKDFPVADDTVITQVTLLKPPGTNPTGGRMDVQAVAKNSAAVSSLEKRLRDGEHKVSTGGGKLEKSLPGYDWSFDLDIRVPAASDTVAEVPKK